MIKDISNMKIQGILANKIYDKTYKNIVKESLKSEEFIISGNEKYIKGDKVSIDRILVDYNFIGVIDDGDSLSLPNSNNNKNSGVINIKVNNKNIKLFNTDKKAYKSNYIQTSYVLDNKKVNKTPNLVYLYKEFQGNIDLKNISLKNNFLFKYGLRFFVDNLKIRIKGKIGEKEFEGVKDYRKYNKDLNKNYVDINPVEITREDTLDLSNYENYINSYNYKVLKNINPEVGLNFTPVNIFEKLNIEEKNKMKIKLKLEGCLFAKEVISVEKYKGNNKIRSLINYVFQIESYIYFMNKEKIAVFVKEEEHL